jgi:CubicO group peptidase (beta-lactamase class C family)
VIDELVDPVFARTAASPPGVAYGVVRHGVLVHAGGHGHIRSGGPAPDEDSVFRIASMTKSFTAALVLALRDRGLLRLDDAVAAHVPAAAGIGSPGVALSVRDLLTMGAGLPTDDPWGDRQESLPAQAFDDLVASGLTFNRPPRTAFEYSNTSYALLGRVIESVTGSTFPQALAANVLQPLGLASTAVDHRLVDGPRLATGYRKTPDGSWEPQPVVLPGAFSAMGGLHSTVRDLAGWIDGFAAAWAGGRPGHPVAASSLREAQELARFVSLERADDGTRTVVGYGFGLMVFEHETLGRMVGHSGGYPGFGSHMRWHPASGWGVVALGNATYAPMSVPAAEALALLVAADPGEPLRTEPHPQTLRAMALAEALLHGDASGATVDLWSENLDLDQPRTERLAAIHALAAPMGPLVRLPESVQHPTPTRAVWRVVGPGGALRLEVGLTPEPVPRIQRLVVAADA